MRRATKLSLVLILLSGLTFLLAPPALHLVTTVHATDRTIVLIGNYRGWNYSQPSGTNPRITVNQGDYVRMQLSSTDTTHKFLVDVDGDGAGDVPDCPTTDPCSPFISTITPAKYNFTASMPPGNYTYYCTIHTTTMVGTFQVRGATSPPDFSINANPTSLNVAQGASTTTTVTLSGTNGFSGTVTLTGTVSPSSSGPHVSFSPSSVAISSGQTTSTLTVSAVGGLYSSVATGNYSVNVTATSGSISHSTSVQVTVSSVSSTPSGTGNLPLTALAVVAFVIVAAVGVVIYLVRRRTMSK